MSMRILIWLLLTMYSFVCEAQKKLVPRDVDNDWAEAEFQGIANNGDYATFSKKSRFADTLFIRFIKSNETVALPRVVNAHFTQNARFIIYEQTDSICIMDLMTRSMVVYSTGVDEVRFAEYGKYGDLMVFKLKDHPDQLILKEIHGQREQRITKVERYWIDEVGRNLLYETKETEEGGARYELNWLDIPRELHRKIWHGGAIEEVIWDIDSNRCVFNVPKTSDNSLYSIWLYRMGEENANKVLDDRSLGGGNLSIVGIGNLNSVNNSLVLRIRERFEERRVGAAIPVDIWSYKDSKLQSQQLFELAKQGNGADFTGVVGLNEGSVIRLEHVGESLLSELNLSKKINFALVAKSGNGDIDNEWNWKRNDRDSIYLISLENGQKKGIFGGIHPLALAGFALSYNEKYIYYYDKATNAYCAYRISNGCRINLTSGVKGKWTRFEKNDEPASGYAIYNYGGYILNSDAILIYDQNDIFELDPDSKNKVRRLTNGRLNNKDLVFRLSPTPEPIVDPSKQVFVTVFDRKSKDQGLIRLPFDSIAQAARAKMEHFAFKSGIPKKATDANLYVVERMRADQSMNCFLTTDFQKYNRISDVFPEKKYNWLTTELVSWKTFDGTIDQGILYKPEDFDSRKKYPMIVYYYERMSDNLHKFIKPDPSDGALNIPFFVSRGYLVFTPDIYYKVGWPGKSAYNAIVSGAQYLARRNYVDVNRLGLQGISFGGFETNYVITHTHLFAAAMSSSGMSDFISAYGSIMGDGTSRARQYELYRDRMGTTPWEHPDLYIENSPVLRADKVTTPLLMLADNQDDNVPVQQGLEFFTALRRLGKKAWMLQYDGEGHGLDHRPAQDDFTDRMLQFFNYYLKAEAPPMWMTRGVPAELKGIETGLELDTSGAKP